MKIDHLAIWVEDLDRMKSFYTKYFNMMCSEKYINKKKQFSSYFLSFPTGARLEIMHRTDIIKSEQERGSLFGLTHFSISVGNKENVNYLTKLLRLDGFEIIGEPRRTGDGYYESVVMDCEENHVEITE